MGTVAAATAPAMAEAEIPSAAARRKNPRRLSRPAATCRIRDSTVSWSTMLCALLTEDVTKPCLRQQAACTGDVGNTAWPDAPQPWRKVDGDHAEHPRSDRGGQPHATVMQSADD